MRISGIQNPEFRGQSLTEIKRIVFNNQRPELQYPESQKLGVEKP
jgi:hypothetical protein